MPSKRMSSACVDYVPALCTHRPSLLPIEWLSEAFGVTQVSGNGDQGRKVRQTRSFRGSKSRNKVSVGEPAEGSLPSEGLSTRPPTLCYSNLVASGDTLRGPPVDESQTLASLRRSHKVNQLKLSTTDLLVLASMKNAAKCDK